MEKFYKLFDGTITREFNISQAFFITTGIKSFADPVLYSKFLKGLENSSYAVEYKPTVEEFVANHQIAYAVLLYRDQHNCTLSEAKIAIDEMKDSF